LKFVVNIVRFTHTRTQEGGELCLPVFSIFSKHSSELFRTHVCSKAETSIISKTVKETQYFYMENHLWPN